MLDACNLPNYYSLGTWQNFAFTKHPHTGPMVILGYVDYLSKDHYLIQQTLINIRDEAAVLITPADMKELISDKMDPILREQFTTDAPDCAAPFLPMEGYTVMFRRQNGLMILQ
jgi:hypothetical protein